MPFGSAESMHDELSTNRLAHSGTKMAPEDSKAPFQRISWIARMINRPGVVCCVPRSRTPKKTTEDTLFADILRTPRTIRSCICFYKSPPPEIEQIPEVSTLIDVGDGINGHPDIMHGGIVATILDESMGIYQIVNYERIHLLKVKVGKAEGELPPPGATMFTAELKVRYLRPVQTPGALVITVRQVKREGRKTWLYSEIKQCAGHGEDDDGEAVVCATGEALFIEPKTAKL